MQSHLLDNLIQWFMLSLHMLNKTSLSKSVLRQFFSFVAQQKYWKFLWKNLSNTCSKLGGPTNLLLKQFVVYYHCFFENFESRITQIGELWHPNTLLKLIKQTKRGLSEYFLLLLEKIKKENIIDMT